MMDEDGEHWWDKAQREHEERLVVGTRVRIIEQECDSRWCKKLTAREGVIRSRLQSYAGDDWDHHDYRVWDGVVARTGWYAAAELEPLD